MNQDSFSILNILRISWVSTKRDWLFLTSSAIVLFVMVIIVNWLKTKISLYLPVSISQILSLIGFVFIVLINVGYIKISILSYDKKPRSYKELFKYFKYVAPFLITLLIVYGLVLIVIPIIYEYIKRGPGAFFLLMSFIPPILAVYVLVRYYFAPVLVVDEGLRSFQALRRSAVLSEGNRIKILILLMIAFLVLALISYIFGLLTPEALVKVATVKTPNIAFAIFQLSISLFLPYFAMMTVSSLRFLQAKNAKEQEAEELEDER